MKNRTLVLPTMAMLFLFSCTQEVDRNEKVRASYKSQEDCQKDWNNDSQNCQYDSVHSHWVGPWQPYYIYQQRVMNNRYYSGMYTSDSSYTTSESIRGSGGTITRGGFGSFGGSSAGE